jgi:PTS system mannose-specific IIC component
MIKGGDFSTEGIAVATTTSIPLAVAGLFLTMIVRTISVGLVHGADNAAKSANFAAVERYHLFALLLQGLRIAIPAALLLAIPAEAVQSVLEAMPAWLSGGMAVGGGMVVAVGYAMVINMMATREVWPFFALGFAFAAISQLTLIALGVIGVAIAIIYLNLSKQGGSGNGGASSNDPIGDKSQLANCSKCKTKCEEWPNFTSCHHVDNHCITNRNNHTTTNGHTT